MRESVAPKSENSFVIVSGYLTMGQAQDIIISMLCVPSNIVVCL